MRRLAVSMLLLLVTACDGEDGPPTGGETGPCYPNATCDEGLACASDLCVDLDGDEPSADDEGPITPSPDPTGDETPPPQDDEPWDEPPPEDPPDDPTGDEPGDGGELPDEPADTCPFTSAGISCSSACAGDIAWNESCDSGPYHPYEDCVDACEYTKSIGGFEGVGLLWYGCMQLTGGSNCDAVTECIWEYSCY